MSTPEKTFEKKVRAYLTSIGAYHVKFFGCLFTEAGVPDILCSYKGRFIAIEVKSEKGKPSKLQLHHKRLIERTDGICIILYPDMFKRFKKFMEELKPAGERPIVVMLEGTNPEWEA